MGYLMPKFSPILFVMFALLFIPSCRRESAPDTVAQPMQSVKKANNVHIGENGELTTPTITAGIDLTKFDQLGHYDCRQWVAADSINRSAFYEKRKEAGLERVRALIWSHWKQRKPSYLRVTYDSVDAVTTHHIFIDLDKTGQRQLILRSLCTMGDAPLSEYPVIHQIELKGTEQKPSILVFKNDAGKTIISL